MKRFSILLAIIILLVAFNSCDKGETDNNDEPKSVETIDIAELELSNYVTLGKYSGMSVDYDSSKISKGDAVWDKVVENSEILAYPEEQIEFYFEQSKIRILFALDFLYIR